MLTYRQSHAGGLGASEVAMICKDRDGHSISPFGNDWSVYNRIHGLVGDRDKPWLSTGRYLERAVCDWYGDQEPGATLLTAEQWAEGKLPLRGPFPLLATPDRIVHALSPTVQYGLEAKTSRQAEVWGEPGSDQIPIYIAVQCQLYMLATGFDRWDAAVFLKLGDEFRRYTLQRDARIGDELLRRAREWWRKHVELGERPQIDDSEGCGEGIEGLFPRQTVPLRQATAEECAAIREVSRLKSEAKALEGPLEEAENRLKAAIAESEGFFDGKLKATWKAQSKTTIDEKALRLAHPEIARQFERTSNYRVLRVTNKED